MSAERFLQLAEDRGFLDKKVVDSLRQQLRAKGEGKVTAQQLAQLLIQKERLTRFQATKLVEDASRSSLQEEETLELVEDDELDDLHPVTQLKASPAVVTEGEKHRNESAKSESPQPRGDLPTDNDILDLATLSQTTGPLDQSAPSTVFAGRKGFLAQLQSIFRRGRRSRPSQSWDSSLILIGGGTLILLTFLGIMLYFLLARGSGDELMDLAQADYDAQSYSQAIAKYEKFIRQYPKHPKRSLAVVRTTLAKLRRNTESQNWNEALEVAQAELPGITQEEAFADARSELAGILPAIYEGFVSKGKDAREISEKEAFLKLAQEASRLVDSPEYLPSSLRRGLQDRLDEIQQNAEIAAREVERENQLVKSIATITQAISDKNVSVAYSARDELWKAFPGLRDNPRLDAALLALSQQEATLVTARPNATVPSGYDRARLFTPRVLLVHRTSNRALDSDGIRYLAAQGNMYALQASDGKLLWRRPVSLSRSSRYLTERGNATSDLIVYDEHAKEMSLGLGSDSHSHAGQLVRLKARSGEMVWSLPLLAPPIDVALMGDQIVVPTANRELQVVDWNTGKGKAVSFPQSLSAAPGIHQGSGLWLLPADDSTVYLMDPLTLQCKETLFSRHGPGTIQTAPTVIGDFVILIENAGADFCWLHTWHLPQGRAAGAKRVGDPIRLIGNLRQPASVFRDRFAIATDRQAIYVFQLEPAAPEKAPLQIAAIEAKAETPVDCHVRLSGDALLVAGQGIAQYRLLASAGRLTLNWIIEAKAICMSLPEWVEENVLGYELFLPEESAVVAKTLEIINGSQGREQGSLLWSTELGGMPQGPPLPAAALKGLISTSQSGRVWFTDATRLRAGISESSMPGPSGMPALYPPILISESEVWFLAADESPRGYRVGINGATPQLQLVNLAAKDRHPTLPPLPFRSGVLVGMKEGSLHVAEASSGKELMIPLQISVSPGHVVEWLPAALVGPREERAIVAEKSGTVYLIEASNEPPLALVASGEISTGKSLVGGIAALGDLAVTIQRSQDKDYALVLSLNPLAEKESLALPERVLGGPWRIGTHVLVELGNHEIWSINQEGAVAWTARFSAGPLAGAPLLSGEKLCCVTVDGTGFCLDAATGKTIPWGKPNSPEVAFQAGEPLSSGFVALASKLIVAARDGALFVLDPPDAE